MKDKKFLCTGGKGMKPWYFRAEKNDKNSHLKFDHIYEETASNKNEQEQPAKTSNTSKRWMNAIIAKSKSKMYTCTSINKSTHLPVITIEIWIHCINTFIPNLVHKLIAGNF